MHDSSGHTLLQAGTKLTPAYIASLRERGYRTVYAANELAPDLVPRDAVREETRTRATQIVRSTLDKAVRGAGQVELPVLREVVDQILIDLRGNSDFSFTVSNLRSVDEYTFVHSVNVCIYSLILGVSMAYDDVAMRQLGLGALLHDIGKMNYLELVARPGPLSPEEFKLLEGHTTDGYEMLRQHDGFPLFSAHVAYQHHERLDGSGYPRGLRDEQILPFARIAAIADIFDAMTADRPYKGAMPLHEAMAIVLAQANTKLDGYLARQFSQRVAIFPAGSLVLLRNGCVAVVAEQSERGPHQPRVRVLTDRARHLLPDPHEIVAEADNAVHLVLADYPSEIRRQMAEVAPG